MLAREVTQFRKCRAEARPASPREQVLGPHLVRVEYFRRHVELTPCGVQRQRPQQTDNRVGYSCGLGDGLGFAAGENSRRKSKSVPKAPMPGEIAEYT